MLSTFVFAFKIMYCYFIKTVFFHIKHICINFEKRKKKKIKYKMYTDAMFLHLINITNDTIYMTCRWCSADTFSDGEIVVPEAELRPSLTYR